MEKETYNSLVGKIEILSKLINGGEGSGNFGHGGRRRGSAWARPS